MPCVLRCSKEAAGGLKDRLTRWGKRTHVLATIAGGLSCRQAAQRLGGRASSRIRWRSLERRQGDARPKALGGDRHSGLIEARAGLILGLVEDTRTSLSRSCGLRPWNRGRAKLPKNYDVVTWESRPEIGGTPISTWPPHPSELSMPRPGVRVDLCELPALLSSVVDLVGRGGAGRLDRFTRPGPPEDWLPRRYAGGRSVPPSVRHGATAEAMTNLHLGHGHILRAYRDRYDPGFPRRDRVARLGSGPGPSRADDIVFEAGSHSSLNISQPDIPQRHCSRPARGEESHSAFLCRWRNRCSLFGLSPSARVATQGER